MKQVKILDKSFQLYIPYEKIKSVVEKMAEQMNRDLKEKNPLFICILNGSFMFATELFKRINLLDSEISFAKFSSYEGVETTGKVKSLIGLNENIKGRNVVILEDIVDTGITIKHIFEQIQKMEPNQVLLASLLLKTKAKEDNIHPDYVGFEIPNDFIVGYGLDYNGYGRNLIDIYSVINN